MATRVCNTQQASSVDLGQGRMRDKVSSSQLETIHRDHYPEREEGKGLLGSRARSEGLHVYLCVSSDAAQWDISGSEDRRTIAVCGGITTTDSFSSMAWSHGVRSHGACTAAKF